MAAAADAIVIVRRLLTSNQAAQAQAAAELSCLVRSGGEEPCADIIAVDGVRPLVALLQSDSAAVQQQGAAALWYLARHGGANVCNVVAAVGAIPALARLLLCSSSSRALLAAHTLASLAFHSAYSAEAIMAAGAVPALVQLCVSGDGLARAAAARALANLSTIPACQPAVAAAGGIEALTAILVSGVGSSSSSGGSSGTGSNAGGGNGSGSSSSGGGSGEEAVGFATRALGNLAAGDAAMQAAIAAVEGAPAALVQLLRSARYPAEAARTIHNMVSSSHPEACAAVAAAGGIAALAEQLASSSSGGGGGGSSTAGLEWVAGALAGLAFDSPKRCASMLSSGCVPGLVQLLGSHAGAVQHNAALALFYLATAGGRAAAAAVAAADGAPALLGLASSSQDEVAAVSSAAVLCELAGAGHCSEAQLSATLPALEQLCSSPDSNVRYCACDTAAQLQRLLACSDRAQSAEQLAADPRQQQQQQQPPHQQQQRRQQQQQRPPRICAAPGCGITTGLRRCGGCGTVRYCGEACCKAHWRAHKPECRRLQAERAAAAAQGACAGGEAAGQG